MDMIILQHRRKSSSFTLIEMLTVIAIIAILAGLVLAAGTAVMAAGMRSRAASEIQGMSGGLESYKVDNGIYPLDSNLVGPTNGSYPLDPSVAGGSYQLSSMTLYQALSGQTNFTDKPVGNKVYFPFKASQLGNTAVGSYSTYVEDPFHFSYGYSPGNGSNYVPYNGAGFFDLWSTGGVTTNSANKYATNSWIDNWTH